MAFWLLMTSRVAARALLATPLMLFWILGVTRHATAAEFYAGKTLTVLINFAAGGPTDIEGRLFAKYFSRHIDGHPVVVVANKDGAAGRSGTVYLGEAGPQDGTQVGYLTAAAWAAVNDPEAYKIPFKNYQFIGFQTGTTIYYARSDTPPGIKQPIDIEKAKGIVVGGQSVDGIKDLLHRLTLDMLGVDYKYVTGYLSASAARLALQRNEIQFYSESPPSYFAAVEPSLVRTGLVTPLFYDPKYDGKTLSIHPSVAHMSIGSFKDLYEKLKGKSPSGDLWDAYLAVLAVNQSAQRIIALPPGAPKEAVDALRKALKSLNSDAEYRAEAEKVIGLSPNYETGDDVNERMGVILDSLNPNLKAFIRNYIESAHK
jgi:tripartite-type tricarboxylate transporter receptor subunit TctC